MATNVGWATLSVIPSFDGFQRNLEKGTLGPLAATGTTGGTRFGDAAGKSAGARFGTLFKRAAQASILGVAALAAGGAKLAADSIAAASDLEESTNKVSQIFGKADKAVFKFTSTAADRLGQANTSARDAASTFGTFGKAAGFADQKNARFAKRMTRLASDLASFHNTEPDEAVMALGAALRGESEPIRKYGVLLDEATLKAEAMALGILKPVKDEAKIKAAIVSVHEAQKAYNDALKEHGAQSLEVLKAESNLGTARDRLNKATEGTIPPLTQQQKLLAAQSQIFKQTSDAQGDFARTSDGLANQQRRLKARFEDAKAELGKGLLPIMTEAADWILDTGLPKFEQFSAWFRDDGAPALQDFIDKAKPLAKRALPEVKEALKSVAGFAKDAAGFAVDMVGAFNEMPAWAKKALITGGAATVAAKKLLPGAAGGMLSNQLAPVRVFETNPAALGKGVGAGGGASPIGPKGLGVSALGLVLGGGMREYTPEDLGLKPLEIETLGEEKVLDLEDGLVKVKDRMADVKAEHQKFLSQIDKTPRQYEIEFKSKGYQELLGQIRALSEAGAGGVANTPSDATPRGYGSTVAASDGMFAGANVNFNVATDSDVHRATREMKRKAARGGFK